MCEIHNAPPNKAGRSFWARSEPRTYALEVRFSPAVGAATFQLPARPVRSHMKTCASWGGS
jgi:hypothetical protein